MLFDEIEKRCLNGWLGNQILVSKEKIISAFENRKDQNKISILQNQKNEGIVVVLKENREWFMQSYYWAEDAARVWAEQYLDVVTDNTVFLIMGIGDGKAIQKLLEYNDENIIIVYEPCAEIFWKQFGKEILAELLESGRVFLTVNGINEAVLIPYLEAFVDYTNFQLMQIGILPNYDRVFEAEYHWMMEQYLYVMKKIIMSRNTEISFNKEMVENQMALSEDAIKHYSVGQLDDIVKKKDLSGMPAVLVSAGPSLDKNIDQLRGIQDCVFILAVDTALNTVLNHEIIPDMTISIDGHKPVELFKNPKIKEIPIALSSRSNKQILPFISQKRFYELSSKELLAKLFHNIGKEVVELPTGGSVANNACALLKRMGFQTIIFMGQDLAYPEKKTHTLQAYGEYNTINANEKKYVKVLDVYGKEVYTEPNMLNYLKWFESFISVFPSIRFIDATEGGAAIKGTEIKSMKWVTKNIVNKKYDKSIVWGNIPLFLNKEEQKKVYEMIEENPKNIQIVKKIVKKELEIFDELKYEKENKNIKKLTKKIIDMNKELEENPVFDMVRYYAIREDYKAKGSLLKYDKKGKVEEQIYDLSNKGRDLFEGYMKAIEELESVL